jgi:hypothetical protein
LIQGMSFMSLALLLGCPALDDGETTID